MSRGRKVADIPLSVACQVVPGSSHERTPLPVCRPLIRQPGKLSKQRFSGFVTPLWPLELPRTGHLQVEALDVKARERPCGYQSACSLYVPARKSHVQKLQGMTATLPTLQTHPHSTFQEQAVRYILKDSNRENPRFRCRSNVSSSAQPQQSQPTKQHQRGR
jgi:hypothetical protein